MTRILSATAALFLALASHNAVAQGPFRSRCGADVHIDERPGFSPLPQGSIFCPLVADPKVERSSASYLRGDFASIADPAADDLTNLTAIGLSDSFGLFRIAGSRPGDGLQLDLVGSIFAQFNLDEPSFDLINADYLVGLPLTFRLLGFSSRLRLYHQSSHLGDEFLISRQPERQNLSFESLELILSVESGPLRLYGGGESFFRRQPDIAVESRLAHGGIELRPARLGGGGRLIAALDVKVIEARDWEVAWSARAGFEIARAPSAGHPPTIVSLLGEYYNGPAPYGQFFPDDIRYLGFGLFFSL
jgi:hypothetical protein